MHDAPPQSILVRSVNWIGDAVMTMPALRALRKRYHESTISLLVKPAVAPLFEQDPSIDEILLYDNMFDGISGRIRLARLLKRRHFTKAILFQNAFDAALIAFLAGIPERIGYRRDARGFLLTQPIPFRNDDRIVHHVYYYLNLLKASGTAGDYSPPWIYLSLGERLDARGKLSGLRKPVLGINPGAAYGSAKRWLPERFAEVAQRFTNDTKGSIVLFGGAGEEGIGAEIARCIGGRFTAPHCFLNLSGKTSIRELAALIAESDLFLTNDSGPLHIAYAVGTPLVALFGSTDPRLTGPVGEGNVVISAALPCGPCFERTCKNNDLKCMHSITSDEVYEGLRQIVPGRPAVFFDRDGTLCKDVGYLNNPNDFAVFPEIDSLKVLKESGFALIGITNQSGIQRGLVDESFVQGVNRVFMERHGFDDFYYCPHGPDEHCSCRKPEPGMIAAARARHRIAMNKSYVVGDKDADMLLAKAVGARGILVRSGHDAESLHADFTVKGLKEAVEVILGNG